jgi:hypothetical protein
MGLQKVVKNLGQTPKAFPVRDHTRAKVPTDPGVYFKLVKLYIETPEPLRFVRAIINATRQKLADEGYQGRIPGQSTMEAWAYYGVRLPVFKEPMSLEKIASEHAAGRLDLDKLFEQSFDDLAGLANDALAKGLRLANQMMVTPEFTDKLESDPRMLTTTLRTLNDVAARVAPKAEGGTWDLSTVERDRGLEIIAEILELHPDLARSVGEVCRKMAEEAEPETAANQGNGEQVGPSNGQSAMVHDILVANLAPTSETPES